MSKPRSHTPFTATVLLTLATLTTQPLLAGYSDLGASVDSNLSSMAEREIARRQQAVQQGETLIAEGDQAMVDKDYELAVEKYKTAYDLIPDSIATSKIRDLALHKLCVATAQLAEQRIAEGEYDLATAACKDALERDPGNRQLLTILSHLEDPDYYNKTITPSHIATVNDIKKKFTEAEGYYATGRYDLAMKRYEEILNFDPTNGAARRGQERIDRVRAKEYGVDAYNEFRSRALWRLAEAWQNPIHEFGLEAGTFGDQTAPPEIKRTEENKRKLAEITIPEVKFKDVTVAEAIDFLKQESKRHDPDLKGINIVLKLSSSGARPAAAAPGAELGMPGAAAPAPGIPAIPGLDASAAAGVSPAAPALGTPEPLLMNPADIGQQKITIELTDIPLGEALRYVCDLAGLKFKVEAYAVSVVPSTVDIEDMITQEFKVPPTFLSGGGATGGGSESGGASPFGGAAAGGAAPAGGGDAAGTGAALAGRRNARDMLEASGVAFPPGSSATYFASTSTLVVKNTPANLEVVSRIVDISKTTVPSQVEIEAKFVEIQENDMKELSFDWLLGQFNVAGSNRLFGSGGTTGTVRGSNTSDPLSGQFPYLQQDGTTVVGQNLMTASNRTGTGTTGAITGNAVDALLYATPAGAAPGIMSLAGIFTDPQFQLVVRALDQKKGIDLLSAPRVTTKSGQRAVIEIIREFRYPTEFDPPQIPQDFGATRSTVSSLTGDSQSVFPVTPTTPTAFETRNIGVTLEVEPVVGPDGFTIDLNLIPSVTEFEGFINYGSPITAGTNLLGQPQVLTSNVINQPVFSSRKVTTSVTIWDGQTVVLGGLMREDVQKVQDKIPGIGDIPLVGRLFRSSVEQHLKRNLVIFVTARLLDPAGQPVKMTAQEERLLSEGPAVVPTGKPGRNATPSILPDEELPKK